MTEQFRYNAHTFVKYCVSLALAARATGRDLSPRTQLKFSSNSPCGCRLSRTCPPNYFNSCCHFPGSIVFAQSCLCSIYLSALKSLVFDFLSSGHDQPQLCGWINSLAGVIKARIGGCQEPCICCVVYLIRATYAQHTNPALFARVVPASC